ncbi:hypothetical protein [Pseudoalteromonas sp. T1lg48]|uniref:hypothetical protein n=1 Tax=Pseudoalteromonas sp. T1lg48 TaxID=2077100 RepID=UPI001319DB64|nr:hypothetical protein [Pseudoalteromonas sp. T1lg48]
MKTESKACLYIAIIISIVLAVENLSIFSPPVYGEVIYKREIENNRLIQNERVVKLRTESSSSDKYSVGILIFENMEYGDFYFVNKGVITRKVEFANEKKFAGFISVFLFFLVPIYCFFVLRLNLSETKYEDTASGLPLLYLFIICHLVYL